MLDFMRRQRSALKWVWVILIFIFSVTLVTLYIPFGDLPNVNVSNDVASIGHDSVSAHEFQAAYRNYIDRMRGQLSPEMLRAFRFERQIMDALVTRHVMTEEAKRLGLNASSAHDSRKESSKIVSRAGVGLTQSRSMSRNSQCGQGVRILPPLTKGGQGGCGRPLTFLPRETTVGQRHRQLHGFGNLPTGGILPRQRLQRFDDPHHPLVEDKRLAVPLAGHAGLDQLPEPVAFEDPTDAARVAPRALGNRPNDPFPSPLGSASDPHVDNRLTRPVPDLPQPAFEQIDPVQSRLVRVPQGAGRRRSPLPPHLPQVPRNGRLVDAERRGNLGLAQAVEREPGDRGVALGAGAERRRGWHG